MSLSLLVSSEDAKEIGLAESKLIQSTYADYIGITDVEVEVALVDSEEMRELNLQTRQINEPTDVLSFPLFHSLNEITSHQDENPLLIGSIVICPEKALAYQETLPQLLHHGLLHVLGQDHETDMGTWQQEEEKVLRSLTEKGLTIPGVPNESL
ncbi:MAG: rRNA maturation RNase YbeY [Patescibacteria group bacterium]|jgi:probable rRNA maturation factor|nr:rRNA maturation RNase YbeY [Patescibacteria group bacterium]